MEIGRKKSKKRGRPEGKNFEFIKSIKLNQEQIDNWDSKKIKAFLDGSLKPKETNDSELIGILKVYNHLFSKITTNFRIFKFIQKTDNSIIEFIENHKEFDKAVELVK